MNLKPSGYTVQTVSVETGCLGFITTADTPEEFVFFQYETRILCSFLGWCLSREHPRWCASSSFLSGLLIILLTVIGAWKKNKENRAAMISSLRNPNRKKREHSPDRHTNSDNVFLFPEPENKPFFCKHDCFFYRDINHPPSPSLICLLWSACWQWWGGRAAVEWCLTVNHNFSTISLLIWALIWGGHISCLFSLACITRAFTLQLQHKPRTPHSWH